MRTTVAALAASIAVASPAAAQTCVSASPGFDACSRDVLTLEVFENGPEGTGAAWVILDKMACTTPGVSPALFALADDTDTRSFGAKLGLVQLALIQGRRVSFVFPTKLRVQSTDHPDHPHVIRVSVPALPICGEQSIEQEPTLGLGVRHALLWPAPIGWSGLNVSALSA